MLNVYNDISHCIYRVRQQKPDVQNFNSKKTFKKQI